MKKYLDCRIVMGRYPAKPFDNEEDILSYVSGDTITCLLCGKEYISIPHHVRRIHDIDVHQYRYQFNIPYKFSLIGNELRQRKRDIELKEDNLVRITDAAKKAWSQSRHNKPKSVPMSIQKSIGNLPNDKPRIPKYDEDYSWHLEQIKNVFNFKNIDPPPGIASWRTFKRRRVKDAELRERVVQAKRYRLERKYL